ncbi:MAG TPA: M14 family metallopeptidase [Gemmatimonadaceae bacterium]|nr:M14 family metallopeptidase [Gemmatimonadaceae bacterium]
MQRFALAALAVMLAVPARAALAQSAPVQAPPPQRDDARFSFYDRGPYRPGVPRPDSILGYAIGENNTQYAGQERVLLAIADAAKDRVRVEEFATTYERRPMRLYIVSSPEHIARLDAIRADLDRLADPRGISAADADAIAARTPPVVWISGSVHGDESPGFETSMQLLYQLAASDEPATLAALHDAIVIINPSSNPDGHERFAVWYNSMSVASPEPRSQEHLEPWSIVGRYNHYRFDMNRDLIATTQREVQGIVRMMLKWHPMVAVDLHGQVATYFFPPAARPVNTNIVGDAGKWLDAFGKANAQAFDRYGWMYFSRDVFDLYYPGYYDTWPSLNGAIGMTFETDGGGWKGLLWRRPDGSLLSFRDGIAKHFVASLATIETTASRAAERVRDYVSFRRQAVGDGRSGDLRRIVLVPGKDPARAAELATTLVRAGIEVRRASGPFDVAHAHEYAGEASGSRRFDAGAYVIDLAQPQGKVARAILEPSHALDPVFAKAQVEKFQRNHRRGKKGESEGYEFYDITAWSLPVAFGVESYWTDDVSAVSGELLTLPSETATSRRVGGELLVTDIGGGVVAGRKATSGYLFGPERNGASRLAYQLLREGFRVSVASQPLEAGGRSWPRGSYVVLVARNDSTLATRIDALARESGVDVTGVSSAQATSAQFGIGSEPVLPIPAPSIAVVADDGVSQTSYGAIWYTLERRYGVRFTPIGITALGGDLSHYTAILLPSGSYGTRISKETVERLKTWVRGGGTLVTMGSATEWAADENVGLTTARKVGDGDTKPDAPAPAAGAASTTPATAPKSAPAAQPDRLAEELIPFQSTSANANTPEAVPGIHADVLLDRTHWLTAGYDAPRLTVLVEGDLFLKPSKEGENVATFPISGTLVRAGFTWPGNTERLLRGTSLIIDEPTGNGHVVLFTNEPMFRGWWRAMDRLVMNALVVGGAF